MTPRALTLALLTMGALLGGFGGGGEPLPPRFICTPLPPHAEPGCSADASLHEDSLHEGSLHEDSLHEGGPLHTRAVQRLRQALVRQREAALELAAKLGRCHARVQRLEGRPLHGGLHEEEEEEEEEEELLRGLLQRLQSRNGSGLREALQSRIGQLELQLRHHGNGSGHHGNQHGNHPGRHGDPEQHGNHQEGLHGNQHGHHGDHHGKAGDHGDLHSILHGNQHGHHGDHGKAGDHGNHHGGLHSNHHEGLHGNHGHHGDHGKAGDHGNLHSILHSNHHGHHGDHGKAGDHGNVHSILHSHHHGHHGDHGKDHSKAGDHGNLHSLLHSNHHGHHGDHGKDHGILHSNHHGHHGDHGKDHGKPGDHGNHHGILHSNHHGHHGDHGKPGNGPGNHLEGHHGNHPHGPPPGNHYGNHGNHHGEHSKGGRLHGNQPEHPWARGRRHGDHEEEEEDHDDPEERGDPGDKHRGSGGAPRGGSFRVAFPLRTNYQWARFRGTLRGGVRAITACLWLRPGGAPRTGPPPHVLGTPFSYAAPGQPNELVLLAWGGRPMELLVDDQAVALSLSPTPGRWHHVCVTWAAAGGAWRSFQDGAPRGAGGGLAVGHPLRDNGVLVLGQEQDALGGRFDATQAFVGDIAGLQLWSRVLDAAEVAAVASCDPHPNGDLLAWAPGALELHGGATALPFDPCP